MPELGSRGGGQQRLPKVKRPFKTPAALAVILLGSILPPIFSAGWALALASPTSYRVAHAQWDGGSKSVVISGDGRHVAYETYVYPDWQVYVFDVNTNATTLVSANSSGAQADTGGSQPSISYDGHYIAFVSGAANLGSSSGQCSIYVRNTVAGTTSLVSVGSNPAGNSCATSPAITPDGRYIAFVSDASDLVPGDTNGKLDVFVRDTVAGATSRVSIGNNGAQSNGLSEQPSISSDGRYVAFASQATNLVLVDANGTEDVFVRDRAAGTTELVSVSSNGVQGLQGISNEPSISGDSRYVAFTSQATGLVSQDSNGWSDIFLRDRQTKVTSLVSWAQNGQGSANDQSFSPHISTDGSFVAFTSWATNLVTSPSDSNVAPDVFRSDLHNGPRGTITRISVGWDGGDTSSTSSRTSDDPAISSTGRYVAFFSSADNVVAGDPGSGVFFRDMGEKDAPVLGPSSKGAVDWFSPNADGVEDTWTEQMGVSDASPPISWTLTFSDSNGIVVRTISGSTSQASATVSATWDGTRDNGTALPDGLYSWSFQATDNWGNPSAPWNGSVGIDRSPPAYSSSNPSAFQDLASLSTLSVTWTDPLSGINSSTAQISVDGQSAPVSVSGNTVTATVSALQPGIHQAVGQIVDKAGNPAATSFIFSVVSLSADSGSANLQGVTVPVNSSGKVPGPSTVTFHGVQVSSTQYHEFLNSSTWVGYGSIGRQFNFGTMKVTFHNGTPLSSTANATIPAGSFVHLGGAVSPSATQLEALVPGQLVTLPDFTVSVPTGYNTSASTASLPSASTALAVPTAIGGVLATPFHDSVTVLGHIVGCIERHPSGGNAFCTVDQTPGLQIQVPGLGPINGFSPLTAPLDQSNDAQIPPSCSSGCASSFDAIQARFVLGCSLYTIGGTNTSVDLCNGANASSSYSGKYFGSYVNGWIYTIPNGAPGGASTYPFWRQDHIDLGSDECPNGGSSTGSVVSTLSSAASDTTALDGASGPLSAGTWPGSLPFTVRLGASTGPTDASSNQGPSFITTSRPYQLQNQNSLIISPKGLGYTIRRGATIDESGTQTNNPHATYNGWSSSSPVTDRLQLTNGTEFQTPAPAGGYAYLGLETFNVTLNFNC